MSTEPHNHVLNTEEAMEVDGFVKVSTEDAQAATDEAVVTHEQFKVRCALGHAQYIVCF